MSLTAFALLIASAFAHAAWNFLGKKSSSSITTFLLANGVGVLCLSPVLLWNARCLPALLSSSWLLLLGTGLFQAVYYTCLSQAYRAGDLSIAYPIVRSATVLFVTLASLALGRGRQLSPLAVAGIVVVAMGILVLPHERFRELRLRDFLSRAALFACLAAVGSMGYSLVDDEALRILRPLLLPESPTVATTLLYAFMEGISISLWLLLFLLVRALFQGKRRGPLFAGLEGRLGSSALTGLGIYVSYTLVLVAMGFARNVSYVVAFRQMSVPVGVALGIIALKERMGAPKLVGVMAVTAGLVMVGVG
jgi:drug/metabolite transporter (DMT)-like permease